ncbi:DUF2797 domain-containing protein [Pigmentibacter sp. JX0631]|uniref:DUF2797 domain-containing protein n=1 Tax=Pigmentibacter sp. JX0631 TaxID=2976982 RepID=UPI002469092A|nr:DUF2797 domain-containing protein [Pigmentibacter sp. JX0631]WGL59393.1 DUF2797 domain-containing protein [Pigmentibacter sp. JX0631]
MNYILQKRNYPLVKMNYEIIPRTTTFSLEKLENKQLNSKETIDINITYFLDKEKIIPIGKQRKIKLFHLGNYNCNSCTKVVKKLFDGFCFPCFKYKACADKCIMSPHLCHYMNGTCREPTWGDEYCYQPHYVYLSYTDKFKVGITRESQIPTRWIDQGATSAVLLAKVSSRNQAGILEHKLKEIIHDKSHWINMLKSGNEKPSISLFYETYTKISQWIKSNSLLELDEYKAKLPTHLKLKNEITLFENPTILNIEYPFPEQINKFQSINLEKNNTFEEEIMGIKGQYLMFKNHVFNVRRHEGFLVDFSIT